MREDEIKIGETYFYVPSEGENIKSINFVFVFEEGVLLDTVRYRAYSASGTYLTCHTNELCNTLEEAINLVICNAHGIKKYYIEYEIKAIKKILKKFKREKILKRDAKEGFKRRNNYEFDEEIKSVLNRIEKYKRFADKIKKLKG